MSDPTLSRGPSASSRSASEFARTRPCGLRRVGPHTAAVGGTVRGAAAGGLLAAGVGGRERGDDLLKPSNATDGSRARAVCAQERVEPRVEARVVVVVGRER